MAGEQTHLEGTQPDGVQLRLSRELLTPPAPREEASASAASVAAPPPAAPAPATSRVVANPPPAAPAPAPDGGTSWITWLLIGAVLLTALAWLRERRRRARESDSILWADLLPGGQSVITTFGNLSKLLPDGPDPAEKARSIYVAPIGETNSRREATLIDLHQLEGKLNRRRKRGDLNAAVLLLQQHLVDFRYTSPWVFLELRELYRQLGRNKEWEDARAAFRQRFGQNAPPWEAPSQAAAELVYDPQLCAGLSERWPYKAARIWIMHWMLGDPDMRSRSMGPPLLPLGVYRDLMTVDELLDEVMLTPPPPPPPAPPPISAEAELAAAMAAARAEAEQRRAAFEAAAGTGGHAEDADITAPSDLPDIAAPSDLPDSAPPSDLPPPARKPPF